MILESLVQHSLHRSIKKLKRVRHCTTYSEWREWKEKSREEREKGNFNICLFFWWVNSDHYCWWVLFTRQNFLVIVMRLLGVFLCIFTKLPHQVNKAGRNALTCILRSFVNSIFVNNELEKWWVLLVGLNWANWNGFR
jgi:hypothetical protein